MAVVEKPDQLVFVLKVHRLTGVLDVRLQKGPGGIVWLKVVPEYPPANLHVEAGKPGQGAVNGPLQGLGVHLTGHHGGKAIHRRVVAALNGGVHHGGVVQLKPALVLPFSSDHRRFPLPLFASIIICNHSRDNGQKKEGRLRKRGGTPPKLCHQPMAMVVLLGSSFFTCLGMDSFRMPSSYLAEMSWGSTSPT